MQVHTFLADSAADAVAQIRAQLGPQAVVLNVRPLAGEGLSRLWQKRRIEVLACLPEADAAPSVGPDALAQLREEISTARQKVAGALPPNRPADLPGGRLDVLSDAPIGRPGYTSPPAQWRIASFLQNGGMLPIHAERVLDELRSLHGEVPPASLAKEMELAAALLRNLWPALASPNDPGPVTHLLVGAPGVGKTVCLCKWLAQAVLVEGRSATVWRLDGRAANTAEALSVYAEILNVPLERALPSTREIATDLLFVDVPGTGMNDVPALHDLVRLSRELSHPKIHLVLNAAYETSLLLNQVRAFSALPLADLIVTHLDEETRWGKLWNLILGTNLPLRCFSAGQNVPGDWLPATPDAILTRQFPAK